MPTRSIDFSRTFKKYPLIIYAVFQYRIHINRNCEKKRIDKLCDIYWSGLSLIANKVMLWKFDRVREFLKSIF